MKQTKKNCLTSTSYIIAAKKQHLQLFEEANYFSKKFLEHQLMVSKSLKTYFVNRNSIVLISLQQQKFLEGQKNLYKFDLSHASLGFKL